MTRAAVVDTDLTERVLAAGRAAGLVACGVTSVAPFDDARAALEQRRSDGLAGGMQFTYRNPARATDPARLLEGARVLVAGAWPYAEPAPLTGHVAAPAGRVARYAWRNYYGELRVALGAVAAVLRSDGFRARVVADDNGLVDRAVAQRAGLGWFGKNANILVPGHGSWVVLGAVVSDAPLTASPAPVDDGCGGCRRCIDGCPTGAIVAPGVVDARRCLAWIVQAPGSIPVEWRTAVGDRLYGCDECQEVCPPARTVVRRAPTRTDAPAAAWIDLIDLLAADDATLLARHGQWYIAGRDPRHLRRNALVALGNIAPPDETILAVLRRFADGSDAMLADHARWALTRIAERAPSASTKL